MKCPRCNKNLMTELERDKFNMCTDCYHRDWTDKLEARRKIDIDTKIQQAKNLIKIYEDMGERFSTDFYNDAVESYKKYLKELEELKNSEVY